MSVVPATNDDEIGTLASLIAEQVRLLSPRKTVQQIARETGYLGPKVIEMFAHGEVKVPIDKALALAKALETDPGRLFQLALQQYWPDAEYMFRELFPRTVSENEIKIINVVRGASERTDPKLTPEVEQNLWAVFQPGRPALEDTNPASR